MNIHLNFLVVKKAVNTLHLRLSVANRTVYH